MTTLYGIKNCDTIKKARRWLEAHAIDYTFHDFRQDGLDKNQLESWVDELGWEVLLNKRGLMWRKVSPEQKANIDKASAIRLLLEEPAMIKRPVLDLGEQRIVGFSDERYQAIFT